MRLVDLDPQFVRHDVRDGREVHAHVTDLSTAQGVRFTCPCDGGHSLLVWFAGRGVPDDAEPRPRWDVMGSSIADLTLRPSVDAKCWHGFVTGGIVR